MVKDDSGVAWSETAGQFTALIGYHFDTRWRRQRTRHYSGTDEAAATTEAAQLRRDWDFQKKLWPQYAPSLRSFYPEHDWSKPVWITGAHSEWWTSQLGEQVKSC